MRKRMFLLLVILGIANGFCQDVLPKNFTVETSVDIGVQPEVNLLPKEMRNYVGKITRSQFEGVVGKPVGEEEGRIVYEVTNTYGNVITALRCAYRETDGVLVSVTFGTPHYLGYWLNFSDFEGFTEKGNYRPTKVNGVIIKVELFVKGFGCQILDIEKISSRETRAVINYHIIK